MKTLNRFFIGHYKIRSKQIMMFMMIGAFTSLSITEIYAQLQINRKGTGVGGTVNSPTAGGNHVDVAQMTSSRFITAMINSTGKTQVDIWNVSSSGSSVSKSGGKADGTTATATKIAKYGTDLVVTASKVSGGIKIATWDVKGSTVNQFQSKIFSTGASDFDIFVVRQNVSSTDARFILAVADGNNSKLVAYNVNFNGSINQREVESLAGLTILISGARLDDEKFVIAGASSTCGSGSEIVTDVEV